MMNRVMRVWDKLTAPQATDEDEARREYMTRVILSITSAVLLGAIPLMTWMWHLGAVPPDMPVVAVLLSALFGGAWWLAYRGYWRIGSYIAPLVLFALAIRCTYVYGVGATNLIEYTTAILLTAMLLDARAQWLALAVTIGGTLGVEWLRLRYGQTTPADFGYWLATIGAFYVIAFLLLRFFTAQFQRALDRVRTFALELSEEVAARREAERELTAYRDHLEELVAQRTAELQESEEKFRELAENIEQVFWLRTTDELLYVSPVYEQMWGRSCESLYQQPNSFLDSVHPEDKARVRTAFFAEEFQKYGVFDAEFRIIHPNGATKWVWARFFPIKGTSAVLRSAGIAQDITARKRAAEELAQHRDHLEELVAVRTTELEEERANLARRVAERTAALRTANAELARAARLKDEFLANMSHELRTPLNAILGMAEALQEQFIGPLNAQQLKAARAIETSGRHLLALINDILDLSKIEAGKLELQVEAVSIELICQTSLQFVKQMALKKKIDLAFSIEPTLRDIRADPRRLKQILVNLLNNAVKFTPQQGKVGLEVTRSRDSSAVLFSVWDTGIGIAPKDIARLFQPFVQADSSLSRQYEGTGLGLTMVARLAQMHGGSVTVESQLGHGSRFTVILPWKLPAAVDEPMVESPEEAKQGADAPANCEPLAAKAQTDRQILLVDDNEVNVMATAEYLRLKGYHIVIARDGVAAIEMTRQLRPALVLMDIQLPQLNGLDAIRHIRADAAIADTPIMALTALAMPGDRERCLEAGADEYMSKPVGLRDLINKMEMLLEK